MISVQSVTLKSLQTITKTNNNQKQSKQKREETMNNEQRTPCEVFSRSMGYIRPVQHFNIGKYSEFCERKTFTEANSLTAGARHSELLKKAA